MESQQDEVQAVGGEGGAGCVQWRTTLRVHCEGQELRNHRIHSGGGILIVVIYLANRMSCEKLDQYFVGNDFLEINITDEVVGHHGEEGVPGYPGGGGVS